MKHPRTQGNSIKCANILIDRLRQSVSVNMLVIDIPIQEGSPHACKYG